MSRHRRPAVDPLRTFGCAPVCRSVLTQTGDHKMLMVAANAAIHSWHSLPIVSAEPPA